MKSLRSLIAAVLAVPISFACAGPGLCKVVYVNAARPYTAKVTLKTGVALLGGFAGTETAREQRDWVARVTILDGNASGPAVTFPSGADASTVLDGFTIRNCSVALGASSAKAVVCFGSPRISHNTFVGNKGRVAVVSCSGGSPTIVGNVITANSGSGLSVSTSTAKILNNTLVSNSGAAIYSSNSPATIANNIIACNRQGIVSPYPVHPTLKNNCVYGNGFGDYSPEIAPGEADMNVDPKLAAPAYGKLHIQPDSPCVDAGDGSESEPGYVDIDGQAGPRDGNGDGVATVDIGADESDGTVWGFAPAIVRVTTAGNDDNDGSGWEPERAKRTVQAAINAAGIQGGEAWVSAGTYAERITLSQHYVYVYGGFAGSEDTRDSRDWRTNRTVLDGEAGGIVVTVTTPGMGLNCVDGFTIRNGQGGLLRRGVLLGFLTSDSQQPHHRQLK